MTYLEIVALVVVITTTLFFGVVDMFHVFKLEKDIKVLQDQYANWVCSVNDDWNGK